MMQNPLLTMQPETLKDFQWHVISGCNLRPESVTELSRYGFIKWVDSEPKITRKAFAHFRRLRTSPYVVNEDGTLEYSQQKIDNGWNR